MEIKSRNLNKNEQYACSVVDIKNLFANEDILFISFGFLYRDYNFDSRFIKRPNIEGLIISSLQINKRLNSIDAKPILSFYVIKDDRYNKYKEVFIKSILPQIYEWYNKNLLKLDAEIPGINVLLAEWTGYEFRLHKCRFS